MSFWKSKPKAVAAPARKAPPVHPALLQCREDGTPLTFTSGDPPALMHGRLTRVLEKHLVIELAALDHGEKPVVGHVVCCNFSHGARSGAFFARLHEWSAHGEALQMVLEQPKEVLYLDVRRAFRVPTNTIRWLAATLRTTTGEQLARVLDVSRLGLGLEASGAGLKRGETVELLVTTDAQRPRHGRGGHRQGGLRGGEPLRAGRGLAGAGLPPGAGLDAAEPGQLKLWAL